MCQLPFCLEKHVILAVQCAHRDGESLIPVKSVFLNATSKLGGRCSDVSAWVIDVRLSQET